MIEALLSGGTGGGYYPNSGPGSKRLLVGDEQLGYFGTVTEELLNNPSDIVVGALARQNPNVNYATFNNTLWNKFFFQGKVIYLPVKPVVSGFSYHDIAKTGLLLGTDGNAVWSAYASYPSYTVKQNFRIFAKDNGNTKSLKVRAIANTPRGSLGTVSTTSEAFLLLNTHFATVVNEVSKFPGFQKAIYPPSEPLEQICGTVDLAGNQAWGCAWTHILRSSPTTLAYYINANVEARLNYFRPVLELETELDTTFKYVYPIDAVIGESDAKLVYQPATVEAELDLQQIAFESVRATGLASQPVALENDSPETAIVKYKKVAAEIAVNTGTDEVLAADVKKVSEKEILFAQGTGIESFPDPQIFALVERAPAVKMLDLAEPYLFNPYFKSAVSDYPIMTAVFQKV